VVLLSLVPFLSFSFPLSLSLSVSLSHSCKQKTRSASYKTNEAPQQQQPKSSFLDPRQPNEELERDEDADKQWQIRGNNNNNKNNGPKLEGTQTRQNLRNHSDPSRVFWILNNPMKNTKKRSR
jgi:hypothetical protein